MLESREKFNEENFTEYYECVRGRTSPENNRNPYRLDTSTDDISEYELDILKRKASAEKAKRAVGEAIDKAFSEGFVKIK